MAWPGWSWSGVGGQAMGYPLEYRWESGQSVAGFPVPVQVGGLQSIVGLARVLVSLSGGLQKGFFQAEVTRSKCDCVPGLSMYRLHRIFSHQLHQLPAHALNVPPAPSTKKAERHVHCKGEKAIHLLITESTY